jgi:rubrerythrin
VTASTEKASELLERSRRISELIDRLVLQHNQVSELKGELSKGNLSALAAVRAGMGAELEEIEAAIRSGNEARADMLLSGYRSAGEARSPLIDRLTIVKRSRESTGDVPERTSTAFKDIEDNIVHRNYMAADAALTELEALASPTVPTDVPPSPIGLIAPVLVGEEVTCKLCGVQVSQDLCPSCGHDPRSPTTECPQCGHSILTRFDHCPFCGKAAGPKETVRDETT